jgi:hypothetical protein
MSEDFILSHCESMERCLTQLSTESKIAFGLACSRRLVPCYERDGGAIDIILRFFESSWGWIAGEAPRPEIDRCAFEALIPDEATASEHNERFQAAVMFNSLGACVCGGELEELIGVAYHCLSLVDNYIYRILDLSVKRGGDVIVDRHPLIAQEMRRQEQDVYQLLEGPEKAAIKDLMKRSRDQDTLIGN